MRARSMRVAGGVLALLSVLACGSGATTPTGPDASSQGTGHPFACGGSSCNSATEVCSVIAGHLPGEASSYTCVSTDGGTPSCNGPSSAAAPGDCGCYESTSGEVTTTLCPP